MLTLLVAGLHTLPPTCVRTSPKEYQIAHRVLGDLSKFGYRFVTESALVHATHHVDLVLRYPKVENFSDCFHLSISFLPVEHMEH
jgi:hypothetical protein